MNRSVVIGKHICRTRDKSFLQNSMEFSFPIRLLEGAWYISERKPLKVQKNFGCKLGGRSQVCSCGET